VDGKYIPLSIGDILNVCFSIIKSSALENKLISHKLKHVVFVNLKITRKLRRNRRKK
jgi:hypothetical protein